MEGDRAAFDRAVHAFTDIKTGEGIGVITHWEIEDTGSCGLQAALATLDAAALSRAAPQSIDTIAYYLLRRWLVAVRHPSRSNAALRRCDLPPPLQRGLEALAAFLEDCTTFHTLTTTHSRLKWARASERRVLFGVLLVNLVTLPSPPLPAQSSQASRARRPARRCSTRCPRQPRTARVRRQG